MENLSQLPLVAEISDISSQQNAQNETPMVRQYQDIKKEYTDCLLFFRLGDFYELFFEDAVKAAALLNITLTKRGRQSGGDIPMCGIPYHAAENYIARLIKAGMKVAICEQMEKPIDAKKRGYKAIVKRDVTRVITAGTLTEDSLLDAKQNNFLVSLAEYNKKIGLAAIDISTGEFFLELFSCTSDITGSSQNTIQSIVESALERLSPKEIIISDKVLHFPALFECLNMYKSILTPQSESRFDLENGTKRFQEAFQVLSLNVFGSFHESELKAAGAILEYLNLTQRGNIPRLNVPKKLIVENFLQIDASSRRSLELTHTLKGERKGSLLWAIDETVTTVGSRLLARSLAFPLTQVDRINDRLKIVAWFMENTTTLESLRTILKNLPDGERLLSRLSLGRGGPRDLVAAKIILDVLKQVQGLFHQVDLKLSPLGKILNSFPVNEVLSQKLTRALKDEVPFLAREGGFIRSGFMPELDELCYLRDEGRQTVAALQTRYVQETGINTLKIKYNNILGYYIEVTAAQKDRVPNSFIFRQSLVNGIRYTTPDLMDIQEKLNSAAEKALSLELALFQELSQAILAYGIEITKMMQGFAILDMVSSFAQLAMNRNYCRPTVHSGRDLEIIQGRHPVIEMILKEQNQHFVPNDCVLNESQTFSLLTGPNMAGKSTYLRQTALCIILAQIGCYVPARSAVIGCVDRLFSRVGAADDLSRGHSTFMVEMIETATILNQATPHSFVILDEIGRGTSTYDGLSLAWATAEHLYTNNKSRTLFATHYHELTVLKDSLPGLICHTMNIKEWEGKVIFLHQVIPGTADKSYGIHVAQLAGIPAKTINRAKEILSTLENPVTEKPHKIGNNKSNLESSINPKHTYENKTPNPLEQYINGLDPNDLAPREALEILFHLKKLTSNHGT